MLMLHMKQMVLKSLQHSAEFSIGLHDLIRLNSIVCHVERERCMMIWFSMMNSDINGLMFEVCILIGLSLLRDNHIAYKYLYKTSSHITGLKRETISHCEL